MRHSKTFGQTERSLARTELYRLQNELDELKERFGENAEVKDQLAAASHKARNLVRKRRQREVLFGHDLFSDPAWDMLLELFISHTMQQRLAVSELAAAAAVPPTTALRWISQLEERELVLRRPDPADARRVFIELTAKACAAVHSYFA